MCAFIAIDRYFTMNNQIDRTSFSLESLSKIMPGVFFWKKTSDSVYMEMNAACAELFGINRKREISGFTDHDIPCKISEFAELFQQQDRQVIETGCPLKLLEIHTCAKNQTRIMLNTKNPLRNQNDRIIGTFAYCIDITKQSGSLINVLSMMSHFENSPKLINGSYVLHNDQSNSLLTNREMDCLFYLLRGKSSKQTAAILKISFRTVEQYIEQLKAKFKCETKSDLIESAVSKGYMNILPSSLFNHYGSTIIG